MNSEPTGPALAPSPSSLHYRVLMLAPTSFFADYGCHVRILEETRALEKLGHQVVICTYHNGRNLPGLDIRRTMSIPWRQDYEVGSSRHKIAFDALLFWRAMRAMVEYRPHIIHAHLHEGALIGYVLSKLSDRPMVFDFQGSLSGEMVDHHFLPSSGLRYRAVRRLERFIDRTSPHILTSSSHATRLLTDTFGCSPRRITVVPDSVNTEVFAPRTRALAWQGERRRWGIPPERAVIVYLGLLAEYQGTDLLLHALRSICNRRDDVHLLLGGYPNLERYRRLASDLGVADRVTFADRVPYERAPQFLSLGDVAVSPKLSETEGAGKLLNYMGMGLPTVAFDTEVSREYLGEHGAYAVRGDRESLAREIEAILADEERRARLGSALRRRAMEHYSWDAAGRRIQDVYTSLMT